MAISKKRKEELLSQYLDLLKDARGVVVTEYRGMTVQHLNDLRGKLREKNASLTITKNTLLKIALNEVGMAISDELLKGPVAVAVAHEDLPQTVKTILEYAGTNEIFVVKGGILGTTVVKAGDLQAISELPPLDTLRAQLIGMTTMPLTQFMGLLTEPSRQVVGVLQAATDGVVNVLAAYVAKHEDAA